MKYDVAIIGGGIVGLATAYQFSEKRPDLRVVLLEKESELLAHQSGHNSGVIHSGIYYKPGSLKATLCQKGREQLLQYCRDNNIPHKICGKVIVATKSEQLVGLEALYQRAQANGLIGVERLLAEDVRQREPFVNCVGGLLVPQTGIVDFKKVGRSLAQRISFCNTHIYTDSLVTNIDADDSGVQVATINAEYDARILVSCGGLQSDLLAKQTTSNLDLRIIPFRGEYYKLSPQASNLVNGLIYPVPDPAFPFLGVHFTRMIDDTVKAGPNAVFSLAREGYNKTDFNLNEVVQSLTWPGFVKMAGKHWKMGLGEMYRSISKTAFLKTLQEIIPNIQMDDLISYTSGVRAQVCRRDGTLPDDFLFVEEKKVIHVCNAPSPAATACLAIGEVIANKALLKL